MKHFIRTSVSLFGLGLLAIGLLAPPAHAKSKDDLIKNVKNALSAAPEAVAMIAMVVDGAGNVLREGSNGYTCLPDDPERPGNSPTDPQNGGPYVMWRGTEYAHLMIPVSKT